MTISECKWLAHGLLLTLTASTCLGAGEFAIKPYQTGTERRLDNPVDAMMNAYTGPAGKEVSADAKEKARAYQRRQILSNDTKNGDFSITFTVKDPAKQTAFGMGCGGTITRWDVGPKAALHLWLKIAASGARTNEETTSTLNAQVIGDGPIKVAIYDGAGKSATFALASSPVDKTWQELDLPLKQFSAADGFDFKALRSVQIEAALPKGAQVWLDDVYFHEGDSQLGVTDKTITQYMAEAAATRPARVEEAIVTKGQRGGMAQAFSAFWRGDSAEGNRLMLGYLKDTTKIDRYNFPKGLPVFYFAFGPKGRLRPNSLSPEVQEQMLGLMRPEDEMINDIAATRQSTWFVANSENLDYHKAVAMFFSQIFMHEPAYADRVYPNPGTTLGFRGADTYLHWIKVWNYEVQQRGNYSDGKKYTAKDHYRAWVNYWKEYMAERARHGFFAEDNANGAYGIVHVLNYHDMYCWSEDKELREQARRFLDLQFARSLQDQLMLTQGGAMCRGIPGSAKNMIPNFTWCFLGGDGELMAEMGLSDYQWPRVLWEMALDRKGRGEYAFVGRKPNEAQPLEPLPEGTDTVILARPDSRIVHYSWVTPDYVMGLRMDHPRAVYQHCAAPDQGIIFPTTREATILLPHGPLYNLVQERGVVLLQHKHYAMFQHPPCFPVYDISTELKKPVQVTFGKDVDHIEEKDGWVFIQEGDAYGAFRIVSAATNAPTGRDPRGYGLYPLATDNYVLEKNKAGTTLTAKQSYDPLIIEMSRKAHHATLADFEKDVLDNPLQLKSSNTLFGYLLAYRGCGAEARELELNLRNDQTPRIDGKYISYQCPAFDSPWIKGAFGSGVVTLTGPLSGSKTVLDFNKASPKKVNNEK